MWNRQYEYVPWDQTSLTRSRTEEARRQNTQSCHEMDSIWKKEKRQVKNQLADDSDERAGRNGSYMGRSTGQSTGQVCMAKFCFGLMSRTGRRGWVGESNYILGLSLWIPHILNHRQRKNKVRMRKSTLRTADTLHQDLYVILHVSCNGKNYHCPRTICSEKRNIFWKLNPFFPMSAAVKDVSAQNFPRTDFFLNFDCR